MDKISCIITIYKNIS